MPVEIRQPDIVVAGIDDLIKRLHEHGLTIGARVLRPAVSIASTPVFKETKKIAETEFTHSKQGIGALSRSLARRVVGYKDGKIQVISIGPKKGYKETAVRPGKLHAQEIYPAAYSHLLEGGHRMVVGGTVQRLKPPYRKGPHTGRVVGWVKAYPYAMPGYTQKQGEAQAKLLEALEKNIIKYLTKKGF